MKKKVDRDIQQDVACELAWDTRVSPVEIGIAVKDGIVILTGSVKSWAEFRAVGDAAHRVGGVLDVVNDLSVQTSANNQRTDTEIAGAVRHALEWDVTVPEMQIRSTVSHGTVTLEGSVALWSERADAERAVERLTGVKRVINHIEVQPGQAVDVAAAHKAVERALERHAEREAGHINLQAADGAVTVKGTVQTWSERDAVVGAIRGTRGVHRVVNELVLQPQD